MEIVFGVRIISPLSPFLTLRNPHWRASRLTQKCFASSFFQACFSTSPWPWTRHFSVVSRPWPCSWVPNLRHPRSYCKTDNIRRVLCIFRSVLWRSPAGKCVFLPCLLFSPLGSLESRLRALTGATETSWAERRICAIAFPPALNEKNTLQPRM